MGANVTSHALRDVFQIARISVANKLPGGIETRATPCVSFSLPDWFTLNARRNLDTISNERTSYILCRNNVIQKLMSIDVNELASIYANFFKNLWNKGYSTKLCGKQIIYAKLTPPYLRERVICMHGPRRSISFPYLQKTLPSKNKIREKNGKILEAAILDTWMRKEKYSSILL